jgi:hypothetical protein
LIHFVGQSDRNVGRLVLVFDQVYRTGPFDWPLLIDRFLPRCPTSVAFETLIDKLFDDVPSLRRFSLTIAFETLIDKLFYNISSLRRFPLSISLETLIDKLFDDISSLRLFSLSISFETLIDKLLDDVRRATFRRVLLKVDQKLFFY